MKTIHKKINYKQKLSRKKRYIGINISKKYKNRLNAKSQKYNKYKIISKSMIGGAGTKVKGSKNWRYTRKTGTSRISTGQPSMFKDKSIPTNTYTRIGYTTISTRLTPNFKVDTIMSKSEVGDKIYTKYYPTDSENKNTYTVIENTNQRIQIITDEFNQYGVEILPMELHVDIMQLAINNKSLSINEDINNNNTYLDFTNFPIFSVNKNNSAGVAAFKNTGNIQWFSIYEDDSFNPNDLIEFNNSVIPEITDEMKQLFPIQIDTLKKNPFAMLQSNNNNTINEDEHEINHEAKESNDGVTIRTLTKKFTNLDFYTQALGLYKKIIKSLQDEKNQIPIQNSENTNKKKFIFEKNILYMKKVNLVDDNSINYTSENISWVMQNSLWVEQYLKLKKQTEDKGLKSANQLLEYIGEEYECDLSGLDEKYIIVNEFINSIDEETYVICGYPDKKMKEHIINFWQDKDMSVQLDKIHQEQTENFYEWFSNLYNEFINEEIAEKQHKNKDITELQKIEMLKKLQITDNSQLFKIYKKQRQKFIIDYINDRYEKLAITDEEKSKYEEFKIQYNKNIEEYFQEIASMYLNKIISYIKYIFIVYKKDNTNGNLIPFIFNIKELNNTHVPILERINKLIKNRLPSIFNIQEEYNTIDKYDTPEYNPDSEYKLFYSRYKYGTFFHIETEYLHTMTNVGYKAYIYKNTITLEEIIYATMTSLYWINITLNYEVKDYVLKTKTLSETKQKPNNPMFRSEKVLDAYIKDRIDKKDKRYIIDINAKKYQTKGVSIEEAREKSRVEIETQEQSRKNIEIKETLKIVNLQEAKIILMYKNSHNYYTFIFTHNKIFYSITLAPNLKNEIDNIINKIHTGELYSADLKMFKIIECKKLDIEDYSTIFKYNPIILKQARQYSKDSESKDIDGINNIDISYLYVSDMLNINKIPNYIPLFIPNLFIKTKPYLYLNNKKSQKYLDYYKDYYLHDKQIECKLDYNENFTGCTVKMCDPVDKINCIFYNVNKCNYDFLEFIDNKEQKIVIYILPHIGLPTKENELYIGNYLDLDGNKPTTMIMLHAIKYMYSNNNYICFLHITKTPLYNTLHFHVVSNKHYKRIFPEKEMGGYMIQDMFIDEVINNLEVNPNYYKNLNFNLIKQY
jgi:hypothetical protein